MTFFLTLNRMYATYMLHSWQLHRTYTANNCYSLRLATYFLATHAYIPIIAIHGNKKSGGRMCPSQVKLITNVCRLISVKIVLFEL